MNLIMILRRIMIYKATNQQIKSSPKKRQNTYFSRNLKICEPLGVMWIYFHRTPKLSSRYHSEESSVIARR